MLDRGFVDLPTPTHRRVMALAALVVVVAVVAQLLDTDLTAQLRIWLQTLPADLGEIHWVLLPVVVVLVGGNYLGSALSLRALAGRVDGRRIPMGDSLTIQVAGAAANRIVPAGLGTVTIMGRYLTRRGMNACDATATTAAACLIRGVGSTAVVLVLAVGLTVHGTRHPLLPHLPAVPLPWVIGGVAVVAVVAVVVAFGIWKLRRRAALRFIGGAAVAFVRLRRRPADLSVALAGAVLSPLSQALAFAVCVLAVPHSSSPAAIGSLLLTFLLGSAAGSAVPSPAGVGPTEAALTVALIALNVPAGHAVQSVALFRTMTYWAPVPIGVVCLRRLQRRGVLIGSLVRKGFACPTSPISKPPS